MRKRIVINDDMTTSFWYDWRKPMIFSLVLNIILGIFAVYMMNIPDKIKHVYHSVIVEEESKDMALTDSGLTAELIANGVVLPNVAVAQATIESGMGKSKVGREAKNLFGITYHQCKNVAGHYGVYAKYSTYRDNVKCYAHIQKKFLGSIDGKYAEDPSYIEKLKSMK